MSKKLVDYIEEYVFTEGIKSRYDKMQVYNALNTLQHYVQDYKVSSHLFFLLKATLKTGIDCEFSYRDVDSFMTFYDIFQPVLDNEYVQNIFLQIRQVDYLQINCIERDREFIRQLCLLTKEEQKQFYEMYDVLKSFPSQQATDKKCFYLSLNYDIIISVYFDYSCAEAMRRSLNNYLQYKDLLQSFIFVDKLLLSKEERRVYAEN